LKKLILIISIFFISITPTFAVFYIDGQVDYISTGEYNPVLGGGLGIGFSIADDVNLLMKGFVAQNKENVDLPDQLTYNYSAMTTGIEYIPPIIELDDYRLLWKNSICLGASWIDVEMRIPTGLVFPNPEYITADVKETGFITTFKTGLQYSFTQTIAPYFDLGYHKTFYSPIVEIAISGWQIDVGVRLYMGGIRDYDSGY